MAGLFTIRALNPRSARELEIITCFSVMTIWESRPELRIDPHRATGYSWTDTHARLKAGLRSDNNRYLVAVDADGHLVGFSIVVIRHDADGQPFGYFWTRYILPRARRQQLATRFLGDGMSFFRSKGARYAEVHIHVENVELRRMFEKRGFKVVDRGRDAIWTWMVLCAEV